MADDLWMRYIVDLGLAGPDKGKGGKYLFLSPGYEGEVPDGSYSNGTCIRFGGNYQNVSVAWQYSWLGRPD
jgi:hypothetical protein